MFFARMSVASRFGVAWAFGIIASPWRSCRHDPPEAVSSMSVVSQKQPPLVSTAPPVIEQADATGGIIPYKNPHALTAYYLGLFSIIPLIGFILGIVALALG